MPVTACRTDGEIDADRVANPRHPTDRAGRDGHAKSPCEQGARGECTGPILAVLICGGSCRGAAVHRCLPVPLSTTGRF